MSDDNQGGVPPQFDNPEAEVHMTQGEFLRQVNELTREMAKVANDAQFAVVIGACMTLLQQCLGECAPEGRMQVYENMQNSLRVALNHVNLRDQAQREEEMREQGYVPGSASNDDGTVESPDEDRTSGGITNLMDGPSTLQ